MIHHNKVHETLYDVADVRGWNEETMIIHLAGFITQLAEPEPAYRPKIEDWERYLQDVCEDEDRLAPDDD